MNFAMELEERRKQVKQMIEELRQASAEGLSDESICELISEYSRNFIGGPLTLIQTKKILPFIKE